MYVNIVKEESMKKFRLFITKTFNEIYVFFSILSFEVCLVYWLEINDENKILEKIVSLGRNCISNDLVILTLIPKVTILF